jgi:hypothetical protein
MIDKIYYKNENEITIIFTDRAPLKVVTDNGTAMELLLSVFDDKAEVKQSLYEKTKQRLKRFFGINSSNDKV